MNSTPAAAPAPTLDPAPLMQMSFSFAASRDSFDSRAIGYFFHNRRRRADAPLKSRRQRELPSAARACCSTRFAALSCSPSTRTRTR